jgi:hypothetical protein
MYYTEEPQRETTQQKLAKWIPRISLIIGICAIMFQIFVLYPWHLELSAEFAALTKLVKNATRA